MSAGAFLGVGVLVLVYALFFEVQVAAFIGLGLTFWGAIFALARGGGRYVETSLLDSTAKSNYATLDRVLNEFKFDPNAYYLPAYPTDVVLPEYLDALRQPLVYLGEDFNGKPSLDEMTQGKFISQKTAGVFAASPGAGLMAQMERQLQLDFGQISLPELLTVLPRSLTDGLNLARTVDMTQTEDGIAFKASGIVYESLYRTPTPPRSVAVLGCPVVSAVASALAKATGKTVTLNDQAQTRNCGANLTFKFLGENPS